MSSGISATNVSFSQLGKSSEFLNLILGNISSCVLLLDNNMELHAFNDAFKTIFSNKPDEHILHKKCGNAIGCAYAVEEVAECGNTSQCKDCELRASAIYAYANRKAVYKQRLSREFYRTNNVKELKHLLYSIRPFYFGQDYYIIVIIEDITMFVKQSEVVEHQKNMINTLCNS